MVISGSMMGTKLYLFICSLILNCCSTTSLIPFSDAEFITDRIFVPNIPLETAISSFLSIS